MFTENYKTLKTEIQENISEWKDILCSQIGRININVIKIPTKAIYRLNAIPVKMPITFLQ